MVVIETGCERSPSFERRGGEDGAKHASAFRIEGNGGHHCDQGRFSIVDRDCDARTIELVGCELLIEPLFGVDLKVGAWSRAPEV
jgi:hypothetical protein